MAMSKPSETLPLPVLKSVPQENWPWEYVSLPVVALQVDNPPPWKELAFNPLETVREPVKEEEVVVALIEKMLEIEAVTPESDAISKKASGVTSPAPNLPREEEAKTNLGIELSLIVRSVVKVHWPVID